MLKATIVNIFCALLLAQASSAAVIQARTCRKLHTDTDTGATATVDCDDKPTSTFTPPVTTSSSCTDTTSSVPTSRYTPPVVTTSSSTSTSCTDTTSSVPTSTSTYTPPVTTSSSSTPCAKCTGTTTPVPSSSPTTTAPGGVPPPHPPRPSVTAQPEPTGPYQGKFFQIIPKGQENMCLTVFSGDNALSGSDGVNVQECDCDHPLYKNTWTLDETSQYTTIMSGKPKSAGDKTWCLDAGSKVPADTTKPHLWECIEENKTPLAVQNWHIDDKSGQISIDFEGKTWCLDREFGQVNDRPVQIWDCVEGNANQQWEVRYLEAAK